MSIKPLAITTLFVIFLAACVPQSELVKSRTDVSDLREDVKTTKARVQEIQRRMDQDSARTQKRIDALDANTREGGDVQKSMADYGVKTDQLSMDIQLLQGKLEENNFKIAELSQKLDDRGVKISELNARIEELEAKVGGGTGAATLQSGTASAKASQKALEPTDAYRQAKDDYDKGNFDLALAGFQNYVVQFPNTSQSDKAQYWTGECYYSLKDFNKAIAAFSKVISNYPKSDKIAGSKLKIGLSYLNEKNYAKAKEYLNKVIKEHPGTNEAAIAKDRLAKMGK
jgi:tol-pal system protein YbgF